MKLSTGRTPGVHVWANSIFYIPGVCLVIGMKWFCSGANAEQLHWILFPTVRLIGGTTGIHFEWDSFFGWVNHPHTMIVGPSCAGTNFLILTFAALYFSFVHRVQGLVGKLGWGGLTLLIAFVLTVGTNAIRIIAAMHVYEMEIYNAWVTPDRIHRALGTLVYVMSLVATYVTIERMFEGRARRTSPHSTSAGIHRGLPPAIRVSLVWYGAFVVGIPVMTGLYRGSLADSFVEHVVTVSIICTIVFCCFLGLQYIRTKTRAPMHVKSAI